MTDQTTVAGGAGHDGAFPRLLGERLCLNFANSVESPRTEPEEFLTDFLAVSRWGLHVGLLDERQVAEITHKAAQHSRQAAGLFAEAIALRTSIQRTFQAIATNCEVDEDTLGVIQQAYLQGLRQCHISLLEGPAQWIWSGEGVLQGAEYLLWRVAESAVDLLTAGDFSRIKSCECGWLFYDTSRNGSRRWCSMEGCGTQAKMRRFTARRREGRG